MKSKKADVVNEESTLVPPDGGWAWVIAICSFWANFINDGVTLCMGLVIVQLAEVFEEPMGKVAWVSSINIAMQLISGKFVFKHFISSTNTEKYIFSLPSSFISSNCVCSEQSFRISNSHDIWFCAGLYWTCSFGICAVRNHSVCYYRWDLWHCFRFSFHASNSRCELLLFNKEGTGYGDSTMRNWDRYFQHVLLVFKYKNVRCISYCFKF